MSERIKWLKERRTGIGSSDAPALLGVCPWTTALEVYHDKIATGEPVDRMTPAMEWGHRLEPVIAGKAIDEHGWTLGKPGLLRHPKFTFLLATPDRVNQHGELVEIKTTSRDGYGWGEAETDDVPLNVWVQVQHQLEIAHAIDERCETAWVCCLIGGSDYRRYHLPRNPAYIQTALADYYAFWDAVQTRNPPSPNWDHPNVVASLKGVHPEDGKTVYLDVKGLDLADEYVRLGCSIREHAKARDEIQARLIEMLGTASLGILPDERIITRREVSRKGFTVEPTTYIDFRISKPKKGATREE